MFKKSIVTSITNGIFGSLVDLFLYQIYLTEASIGKSGSRGVYEAFRQADKQLEKINHQTLIDALHKLKQNGWVSLTKRKNIYDIHITKAGQKRLSQTCPSYQYDRSWDKRMYLITYDISENAHSKRDKFRRFLYTIGCRLLQESTWITPYNPRLLIKEFCKTYSIPGTIIVSDIPQDGGIGETTLQELIIQVFKLEDLNKRYRQFLDNASKKNAVNHSLLFAYLSILKDDPQLPFDLLPKWWLGDKSNEIYQKLLKNEAKIV
jgi:DNA-binding transcriptional regulator PaaX